MATAATGQRPSHDSRARAATGQRPSHDSRARATTGQPPSHDSRARAATGQRPSHDSRARAATGQRLSHDSRARTAAGQRPSHDTSNGGAAPLSRQEQRRGSALHATGAVTGQRCHTTGAATGQHPSHNRSSKGAALRHDKSSDGPAPKGCNGATWGLCPSTAGRAGRSVPPFLVLYTTARGQLPVVPPPPHSASLALLLHSTSAWLHRSAGVVLMGLVPMLHRGGAVLLGTCAPPWSACGRAAWLWLWYVSGSAVTFVSVRQQFLSMQSSVSLSRVLMQGYGLVHTYPRAPSRLSVYPATTQVYPGAHPGTHLYTAFWLGCWCCWSACWCLSPCCCWSDCCCWSTCCCWSASSGSSFSCW